MKINLVIAILLLLSASFLLIGAGCESMQQGQETGKVIETGSQTYNIDIINFEFSPQTLNIKVGDTVTWTNQDSIRHDIKSNDGDFYSIPLNQGESYSFTFNQPGTFDYRCGLHPTMEGTIIVE